MIYEIKVEGHLNPHWSEWFCPGGECPPLELTQTENGETIIRGDLIDQAALQGVLTKIWNLGLTLDSVVAVRKKPRRES
ncbi:hypothetical protein EHM92_01945 [bacterium]|nr:MAG: hypothetical protein EHM92_01945 [bacterium]